MFYRFAQIMAVKTAKRMSNMEYDRFSNRLKDEIYEKMDRTKALMACFVVDEKVSF